jgi:hypothetical protein
MPTGDESATRREVRRCHEEGRLIPFIGAGLSKPLGLPTFSDLIDIIATQLGYEPEVYKLNGNEMQLAEYYVATKGSIGPLRSEMDRRFDRPPDETIAASRAHNALVAMQPSLIYTTNYDRIIERAFELNGVPCHTIASIDDMVAAPSDRTHVVKFHGSFSDDASLVLTESSYFDRLEFESAIDIKLRADMLGKTLLFVGYSLSDLNIRYMLYKLHKLRQQVRREGKRYPSAYLATFRSGEIQRTLLARWDVSIVELNPEKMTDEVDQFLESLVL